MIIDGDLSCSSWLLLNWTLSLSHASHAEFEFESHLRLKSDPDPVPSDTSRVSATTAVFWAALVSCSSQCQVRLGRLGLSVCQSVTVTSAGVSTGGAGSGASKVRSSQFTDSTPLLDSTQPITHRCVTAQPLPPPPPELETHQKPALIAD